MKKDMLTRFLPAFTQKKKNLLTKVYHLLFNSSTIRILFQTTSHTIMKTCLCWNSRILNNICQKTLVFHAPTHNSRTLLKSCPSSRSSMLPYLQHPFLPIFLAIFIRKHQHHPILNHANVL